MGIVITIIICATVFAAFKLDIVNINVNFSATYTTEISDSFKQNQQELQQSMYAEAEMLKPASEEEIKEDVLTAVRNMWEGAEED